LTGWEKSDIQSNSLIIILLEDEDLDNH